MVSAWIWMRLGFVATSRFRLGRVCVFGLLRYRVVPFHVFALVSGGVCCGVAPAVGRDAPLGLGPLESPQRRAGPRDGCRLAIATREQPLGDLPRDLLGGSARGSTWGSRR